MDKNDILKVVSERGINFIRLWFTDILGSLKCFTITATELETALNEGIGFDGSSVTGFHPIEESDCLALPDPDTFAVVPYTSDAPNPELTEARLICDIYEPDGAPFAGDPRYILKSNLKRADEMGFTLMVGPELEYFYFNSKTDFSPLDLGTYFDFAPLDSGIDLRKKTILALQSMDIPVEISHHEVASSQHEIDLKYSDALTMADAAMTYKKIVKKVASENNVFACFMPKPIFADNGSGMHTHQSLFRGETNAFFDPDDKYNLSDVGKRYTAGILAHAKAFTAICNPTVNSYKRLVPGYEAPIYISWSQRNRSALVRLPNYKPGKEHATRIEVRSPDPSCNPYLAFSVMLASGLEGIKQKLPLPEPVHENVYSLVKGERVGELPELETLPGSLLEALLELEADPVIKEALGEHVYYKFVQLKRKEWEEFNLQVTSWELEKYMDV